MRLTTKVRYGVRAIFDIAYQSAGLPVAVKDISKRQAIPQRYLEQILHNLKKARIIKSIRGPNGGYVLGRDPAKITVGDIIEAVHEPINPVFCVDDATKCARAAQCVTRQVWKEAGEKLQELFDSKTIGDMCEKARAMGLKKDIRHPFNYNI
jgi:Rrf2 family protein